MQIKTAMNYHNTSVRIATRKTELRLSAGKDVEMLYQSHIAGENVKSYTHSRGAWVAHSVEWQTLDFHSSHGIRVMGLSPV